VLAVHVAGSYRRIRELLGIPIATASCIVRGTRRPCYKTAASLGVCLAPERKARTAQIYVLADSGISQPTIAGRLRISQQAISRSLARRASV
jgi:hypothetical protein